MNEVFEAGDGFSPPLTAARVLAKCRPDDTPLPGEIKLFAPVLRDAGLLG